MCRADGSYISDGALYSAEYPLSHNAQITKRDRPDLMSVGSQSKPTEIVDLKLEQLTMIKACQINNCYLVIDEAFYDFTEEGSTLAPVVNDVEHVIIIRSLTKMFSLAGLRLGYGIAHPQMIEKLKTLQAHWNVNALVLAAGEE